MTVRKRQVSHLLHDVENLISNKNLEIPKLGIVTGIIIIILVPFTAWMSLTVPFQDEDECRILVNQHFFGFDFVKDGNNCFVLFIVVFVRQFFQYTLRTAVTVVYVIICSSLRNVLNTHSELGAKRVTNPNAEINCVYFKSYLQTHESVLSVLKSFEKTMSLPIFLIVSSNIMAVMFGVVIFDPLNNVPEYISYIVKYIPAVIFISLSGMASFLCICFAASEVHEAGKNARDVEKDMLKRILNSGQTSDIQKVVPFSILHSSPPFVLSAW
ncbi:uncharacterized protein NPIL_346011, partial [Nephila pilipes]